MSTEPLNYYHLMLGLPESTSDPDFYELLRLDHFESDAERIRHAVLDCNDKLSQWEASEHYHAMEELREQLVDAEEVFSDEKRKAAFDADLKQRLGIAGARPAGNRATPRSRAEKGFVDTSLVSQAPSGEVEEPRRQARTRRKKDTVGQRRLAEEFEQDGRQDDDIRRPRPPNRELAGDRKRKAHTRVRLVIIGGACAAVFLIGTGLFVIRALLKSEPAQSPPITSVDGDTREDDATTESFGSTVVNSIGAKFVRIESGAFLMGSPEADNHADSTEKPQHRVRITKPFYLATTEVTQGQWEVVMGTTPWKGKSFVKEGTDCAATYVSWDDSQEFCRKLSTSEGVEYRLPTEAEWEYACRAGSTTSYSFGDDILGLKDYAWWGAFSAGNAKYEKYAHEVGGKRPNAWGLHDMHGNVWEWCADWYDENYYENAPLADTGGARVGEKRVVRGGSWLEYGKGGDCRSANRQGISPHNPGNSLGFRVVRSSAEETATEPTSNEVVASDDSNTAATVTDPAVRRPGAADSPLTAATNGGSRQDTASTPVAPSGQVEDSFEGDSLDTTLWTTRVPSGLTSAMMEQLDGSLRISGTKSNSGIYLDSRFALSGNCDVAIDYQWPKNAIGHERAALWLRDLQGNEYFQLGVHRYSGSGSEILFKHYIGEDRTVRVGVKFGVPRSGKLRLSRSGSRLTGYYWSNDKWVEVGSVKISTIPITVSLNANNQGDSGPFALRFDNFVAKSSGKR